MKRSNSRASFRLSNDAGDIHEPPPPGIPDSKWRELLEKEDFDFFILEVREDLMKSVMKQCYDNYMKRQAAAFTVHCAYLAWIKVIDIYYMFRDPGDTDDPNIRMSWEPDPEPEPSTIDSWGNQCIKAINPQAAQGPKASTHKETSVKSFYPVPDFDFLDLSSRSTYIGEKGENECYIGESYSGYSSLFTTRKRSIFTRTLSMSRADLPLVTPLLLFEGECKERLKLAKKKFVERTPPMVPVPPVVSKKTPNRYLKLYLYGQQPNVKFGSHT